VAEESWYLIKVLDLSPDAMGVPALHSIDQNAIEKLMSKCGKHISQIIYKSGNQKLRSSVVRELPSYIATYCFNVTSLDLTASIIYPREIEILSQKCNKIKKIGLLLSSIYGYEDELTKLFEVNKDLEDITLYKLLCPSLMKLPEQKVKAITLEYCLDFPLHLFSSVSIIQFFPYILLIIVGFHPCRL